MYKKLIIVLLHFCVISLWAQELPIGQFKEYFAYNRFYSVAQDDENVYAATDQSILVVDKEDGSIEKWSKLNGLSEVGVQLLHNDQEGRLFIAYTNSNIDIIKKNKEKDKYEVYNIRDILNKQLTGSKIINHIFTNKSFAYFSCDFGVVILNLKTFLVEDAWFTIRQNETYSVRCFATHNHHYYLATNKGVFSLPDTAINPADFSTWKQETELPTASYRLLCSYGNKLFAVREIRDANDDDYWSSDSLFVYENAHWQTDYSIGMRYYKSFEVKDGKMLVCDWHYVKLYQGDEYTEYYWYPALSSTWPSGVQAIFDDENIWVADDLSGLIQIDRQTHASKSIKGDGPANNNAYGLCFTDGMLAVVPGARSSAIVPDWTPPAISILSEDSWWSYRDFDKFDYARGFNSVAINPLKKNEVYIASWLEGLFKINTENADITLYRGEKYHLTSMRADSAIFVSGLAIDKQNNLWMTQTQVFDVIKVKELNSEEEKWHSFNLYPYISTADAYAEHLLIDSRNYKWITIPNKNKLIVFSENGSLTNTDQHKKAEVDLVSQVNIKGSRITCIAEDREGRIWTGADQGVKVIYDAAAVFNRQIYAKNILLDQKIGEREGDTSYAQNLLEFEYITCIAVDAANRKWIGTRNAGVFLINPSGTQELFHFTTENTPLFSNQINDIKINPENGEVFFATTGGLISYKGTATAGKEHYKEVLVYPNPVREDYYGPIAVKGLMEDSFCKITDAAGNLVWQGYAYGGQLIWNGKDFYGNRPATGVYFIMASSKTGKEKKVAKLLFVQ